MSRLGEIYHFLLPLLFVIALGSHVVQVYTIIRNKSHEVKPIVGAIILGSILYVYFFWLT